MAEERPKNGTLDTNASLSLPSSCFALPATVFVEPLLSDDLKLSVAELPFAGGLSPDADLFAGGLLLAESKLAAVEPPSELFLVSFLIGVPLPAEGASSFPASVIN